MTERVYVVEIRKPGDGDDEWLIAYYAEDSRAPGACAMGVFGNPRDAQNAARSFDPKDWEARVRSGWLSVNGRAITATGRGVTA